MAEANGYWAHPMALHPPKLKTPPTLLLPSRGTEFNGVHKGHKGGRKGRATKRKTQKEENGGPRQPKPCQEFFSTGGAYHPTLKASTKQLGGQKHQADGGPP